MFFLFSFASDANCFINFLIFFATPKLIKFLFCSNFFSFLLVTADADCNIYRVFHVKWQIKKRCVFSFRNAKKYLKIVSWSSLIAIFCGLNKNISNHTTEVLYCMLFPMKTAKIHGFCMKNLIFSTTISFWVEY